MLQVDGGSNDIESESLLLLAPKQESRSCFGRVWSWVKSNPGKLVRGAVATASSVGLFATSIFVTKELINGSDDSRMQLLGIGAGVALPAFFGSCFPGSHTTATADWVSRWGFEILQAMTEFYVRAGCPMLGRGFWNTDDPPLLARQLAGFSFSTVATTLTALSLRTLTTSSDDEPGAQRESPLRLFLEGGAEEMRRLCIEQIPKVLLCAGSLALYNIEGSEEWLDFGYYLLGHIGGIFIGKSYLWAKYKTIEPIENKKVKAVINKLGVTAELLCFGTFLAWTADASYLLSGVMAGAVKIAVLDKFQYLSRNDEQVLPLRANRVEAAVKATFLAINFAWYISMVLDSALPYSQRVGITLFLASSVLAYPLTRYLAANFRPEEGNSTLFNTFRFYFVNYEEALLIPYMFIKDSGDVGIIGSNDQSQSLLKAAIALTSLGLSVGNNRALQDIRSHRSPSNVSDLALLVSWFILYREWQK